MRSPALTKDLEALCKRHNISSAMLVIPDEPDNYLLIMRAISKPVLRSIGRMLMKHSPIIPGPGIH